MKTILIPVTSNFFVRNFLRTDAFKIISQEPDLRLVLLVNKDKIDYYRQQFNYPNLIFDILPKTDHRLSERLFKFLEVESIHTHHVMMRHYKYFKQRESRGNFFKRTARFLKKFLIFCLRRFLWRLGKFYFYRSFIRKLYYTLPSSVFSEIFERWKPDLAFCPTLIYSENFFLREAKKRGIKTLGMVLSWDNLYTKSFFRVQPDYLVVHTQLITIQCLYFADYPEDKIFIIGIPQYDRYFRKEKIIQERAEFFTKIGADPSKKLILYAFSGKDGLAIDLDMLDILYQAIQQGLIKAPVDVLIRPYPKFDFSQEYLDNLGKKYGFLAFPATDYVGQGKDKWEFDEAAIDFLTNSLAHADLIINLHSTFFIEGAIFDKPLIAIAFDGYQKLNYWHSARRFFDWNHLADLKPLNGIWLVKSKEEFIEAINKYLEDPSYLKEGRKKIILQQCQFTDDLAGRRLAEIILKLLQN